MDYGSLYFDQISSTNDYLKTNFKMLPRITFIKAKHQIKGRGQFERVWVSNNSENILCSVLIKDISFNQLKIIESLIYDELMLFLKRQGVMPIFKLPNDIYVNDSKMVGILIETLVNYNYYDYIIIGIGININQVEFEHINATSLKKITNRFFDIGDLYNELKNQLLIKLEGVL